MQERLAESASKRESRLLKAVNRLQMTSSLISFKCYVSSIFGVIMITSLMQLVFLWSVTKESVDIEDLVDDFITFYMAGQDSTQSLLTFALVLTLLHPHVLER